MKMSKKKIDDLSVAAIRSTCIDAINNANSGHPGAALSLAPIIYMLFKDFLIANPFKPNWINRDRVVLSCGHASILLYTVLHLCGYNITKNDLKKFRKLNSLTPGHPEVGRTEGVDVSTGPLGQGVANSVGLAISERILSSYYSDKLFNHYTYCICGDGCLEEGISQEAITFAGANKLNKLILLYDSNDITLDGPLSQSDLTNTKERFLSANWGVIVVKDGNNLKEIHNAIDKAKKSLVKPTLIIFKTIIGYGSKNEGTCKVHGSPLGEEDGKLTKEKYGYDYPPFEMPEFVYNNFKESFISRANKNFESYNNYYLEYSSQNPKKIKMLEKLISGDISSIINELNFDFSSIKPQATRNTSEALLNFYHENLPFLVGGSADVASSVKTHLKNGINFTYETPNGANINWGIREFLMCAAQNGITLSNCLRCYTGSFLVFSDYAKAALRMAALMELPNIYLFSHDSIAVGEDGPTHEPIEQLITLRSIPNFNVIRPCDVKETYGAYRIALKSTKTPTAIVLSRQTLPNFDNTKYDGDFEKGAYILSKSNKENPDLTIIATGSEVSLAMKTKIILEEKGYGVDVVSMPSTFLFDNQSIEYQKSIIRCQKDNVYSIEMGSTIGWYKYSNHPYGIDRFGESGKDSDLLAFFKFTVEDFTNFILNNLK